MLCRYALVLIIMTGIGGSRSAHAQAGDPPAYEVYAVRYATLRDFAVANLVQGADRARKLDLAMTVWVLKGADGRTVLVDGDAKEIIPGVTVYTGGRHTFASQYVGVNTTAGRVVIASDNLYLYENLDKHVAIAQTFDAKANLAAQDRMKQLAASPRLIIPGHDPEVFVRFSKPGNGVARLE
jgi:glyoxylase-like metal-dependent hydrolase (beta-lactamase superfamily II)